MSTFVGYIRKEKEKATIKNKPMIPTCMGKIINADESWKCRKFQTRKKRLRRVLQNKHLLLKRNEYKAQNNPKNLINKRNRLLFEARLLHIHEIKTKNEKEIRKTLHIKQKRKFLENIFTINKIQLVNRGGITIKEIIKKELTSAKEILKDREIKFQKFNDDKLLVVSEASKRRAEHMKNAEKFIRKIIENLRVKGIKKLNIDLITDKGSLENGIIINVEKNKILVKNSEVVRHLVKKSNYSKLVGQLSGGKKNLSIETDQRLEPKSKVPVTVMIKDHSIEFSGKRQPIKIMKFDSNIRSPIDARNESKEFILDLRKSLNIIKFNKNKGNSELVPKSDIKIRSPALVKVSSQVSSPIKIGKPKPLVKSLSTGNQIPKAKAVDTSKKDIFLKTKVSIQSEVSEKKNGSTNSVTKESNTSLPVKQPVMKDTKVLVKNTLIKDINAKETRKEELISKKKSIDVLNLTEKSKSVMLKSLEVKESLPTKNINDLADSGNLDQNQVLKKTFSKIFPKAIVKKPEALNKTDIICKKVLPKQLEKVKSIIMPKKKSDEVFPISKPIPKMTPNTLETDNYNILIYDTDKYWSSRLYDLYKRMKGESSQINNVSKKCLKRERRRLSTRSIIEKRRIRIYKRLRLINGFNSKKGKYTKILVKPGILKKYGIPALMSYSYRKSNQALSSDIEQKYLVHKLSPNYTDKSHIEYILDNANSYVFAIHKHHELLSIARNSLNEDIQSYRTNRLSKYALKTKMSNLEQCIEEVMGEMIISGDLKQESRENMLENNIMRLRYLVNTGRDEKQTFNSCKNQNSDGANELWDKLISRFNLSCDYNSSRKISNCNNLWKEATNFIYEEEADLFKKIYYLSDLKDLENINIDDSVLESVLKSIRLPCSSQDFKFPLIFSEEIRNSKNTGYNRRDFISYVGKLSPWTKMALIQKRKKNRKSI